MTSKALVISPRTRELEKVIERGINTFMDVGAALVAIRQERRYREYNMTFDEYCRERWGFKKTYVNDLMASAKTVAEIETSAIAEVLPANEGQVRELRKAEAPAEVWAEVVEQHEPQEITAAVIREHVEARKPEAAEPEAAPDDFGVVLNAVTSAVRAAVRAGATSQEIYNAYQAGLR